MEKGKKTNSLHFIAILPSCQAKETRDADIPTLVSSCNPSCRHATFHHLTAMIQIHLYLHILPRFHDDTIWTWHEKCLVARHGKNHDEGLVPHIQSTDFEPPKCPKPVVLTTVGGESDISYPSRLISSMRMPNCISPRPRISK